MIKRKSNWPEILSEELDKADKRPFEFGKHDCCLFAANILKAMTGNDFACGLRNYRSAAGSIRMLQTKGAGTLSKTMTVIMRERKCKSIPPAQARRGDLVMAVPSETDELAVGICVGTHAAFATDGVSYLPMAEVKRAWRCG